MAHSSRRDEMTQMALDPQDRPRYSAEQLQAYFERIQLPAHFRSSVVLQEPALAQTAEHGLPLLRALHRHHVTHIPFENLELHYSTHRTISLNMADLYAKFVGRGLAYGRGGRCMENNGFFGTALRSLGFDVRNAAGRVSRQWSPNAATREQQGATYDGWNHMLNLVRIGGHGGQWWVVDVGMGAMGPGIIYPLHDGHEELAVAPRKLRLQRRAIPEHAARDEADAPQLWCYDVCLRPASSKRDTAEPQAAEVWLPTYCFTETEFLPQDYEMMSWFTSTYPRSFFTYSVLCQKLLLDESRELVVGDVTLFNNSVKKTIAGKRDFIRELKSERERIQALDDLFGVRLTEEEQRALSPALQIREVGE